MKTIEFHEDKRLAEILIEDLATTGIKAHLIQMLHPHFNKVMWAIVFD